MLQLGSGASCSTISIVGDPTGFTLYLDAVGPNARHDGARAATVVMTNGHANSSWRFQPFPLLSLIPAINLSKKDLLTDGFLINYGLLHPTKQVIGLSREGPTTIRPSISHDLLHHTKLVPCAKSDE